MVILVTSLDNLGQIHKMTLLLIHFLFVTLPVYEVEEQYSILSNIYSLVGCFIFAIFEHIF